MSVTAARVTGKSRVVVWGWNMEPKRRPVLAIFGVLFGFGAPVVAFWDLFVAFAILAGPGRAGVLPEEIVK